MGTHTPAAGRTSTYSSRIEILLLTIVLVGGFSLRVWNINFDHGVGSHPDERSTACFVATTIGWPQSWDEFRDPQRSPLNPLWNRAQAEWRSFTYGHFPLYLGVGMGEVMHRVAPAVEPLALRLGVAPDTLALMERADRACDAIAVAGRLTIALLDTLTIWLVFLLGVAVFPRQASSSRAPPHWFALLAAAFYAFTAQAIQLSHFFAMDPASTTFTVMAVLGGVYMVRRRTWAAATLCGVGAGLAVASKFSALPILAVPVVAGFFVYFQATRRSVSTALSSPTVVPDSDAPKKAVSEEAQIAEGAGRAQFYAVLAVAWTFLIAFVSFALTSPYAILDWQSFVQATLVEQGRMVRGVADFPFTRQYRGTTPYLYFIEQQLAWGMWWPLGLTALIGALAGLALLARTLIALAVDMAGRATTAWSALSDVAAANVVVWAWVLPYFGITGAFLAKFNRYMSPILPFAALFAAGLVWALWHANGFRRLADSPTWRIGLRSLAVAVGAVALLGSVFWSAAYVNGVYGREHTWITASRWIYENVPEGSVILWELWDDPLPVRAMPDDPQMNMGTAGLRNIDWSPYEEDTQEKYLILRERLREADYVAYSSKRIYGSVENLPERYPMTIRYYAGMWDGSLGFEIAVDVTSSPSLFGWEFDDRHADESWSLYDHPRATVFRKVRDLSDAEFDAYFDNAWEAAIPYYRGADSFLSPVLEVIGLGQTPGTEQAGILGRVIGLISEQGSGGLGASASGQIPDLLLDRPLAELPLVDNYRWNSWAGAEAWRAALVWWGALWLVGIFAWPLLFSIFTRLRDRGYMVSRTAGWLLCGWILWIGASVPIWHNTVRNAWLVLGAIALLGGFLALRQWRDIFSFLRQRWPTLLIGEGIFAVAFVLFVQIRILNPDLWQPWHGGEKFMEFAFLNGILRSPTFPPVNPHFAGGFINYYYYGLYLVAYLIKLTGIYAEIAFNLAVASLFALTVLNAFAVVYHVAPVYDAARRFAGSLVETSTRAGVLSTWQMLRRVRPWRGVRTGLLAAAFVTFIGNLEGFAQLVRNVGGDTPIAQAQGVFGFLPALVGGVGRLLTVFIQGGSLPAYDFWGPSRVIPHTINEFPYWTFLFADLHPHMIGIPFTLLFLAGAVQTLQACAASASRIRFLNLFGGAVGFGFVIGALAAINLWEYPTFLGLGLLLFWLLVLARRIPWVAGLVAWLVTLAVSYMFYLPFFSNYEGVGASGIGLVREPDALGPWLLIWGFFLFVLLGWLFWKLRTRPEVDYGVVYGGAREWGLSRLVRLVLVQYDRLPRLIALWRTLLRQQTFGFLAGIAVFSILVVLVVLALVVGRGALAISLLGLLLALPLLLRANLKRELSTVFAALLAFTGFLLLAGTQVFYVRDFLQGGDWYRMNTLFKFFIQVWGFFGLASAIAFVQLWRATRLYVAARYPTTANQVAHESTVQTTGNTDRWSEAEPVRTEMSPSSMAGASLVSIPGRIAWRVAALCLLLATLAYPLFGTPARLEQRMVGWRPPLGTLDGMAFMQQGSYSWPDDSHRIELRYDHDAIQWLLANVRGNLVIAESAEVDYYRAGGTRVASFTGLSGLMGKHENEQRSGAQVGQRHGLMREFWETADIERTLELAHELEITLVYAGQLERHQHPQGVEKMQRMADLGYLETLFENGGSVIYAFPERLTTSAAGYFVPVAEPVEGIDDVG